MLFFDSLKKTHVGDQRRRTQPLLLTYGEDPMAAGQVSFHTRPGWDRSLSNKGGGEGRSHAGNSLCVGQGQTESGEACQRSRMKEDTWVCAALVLVSAGQRWTPFHRLGWGIGLYPHLTPYQPHLVTIPFITILAQREKFTKLLKGKNIYIQVINEHLGLKTWIKFFFINTRLMLGKNVLKESGCSPACICWLGVWENDKQHWRKRNKRRDVELVSQSEQSNFRWSLFSQL